MQTLKDRYPTGYQALREAGFRNICEMLGKFTRAQLMAPELAVSPDAISKWLHGKNSPSMVSEKAAYQYLRKIKGEADAPAVEPAPVAEIAPMPAQSTLFIVAVPAGASDKFRRVASILGCEVLEDA